MPTLTPNATYILQADQNGIGRTPVQVVGGFGDVLGFDAVQRLGVQNLGDLLQAFPGAINAITQIVQSDASFRDALISLLLSNSDVQDAIAQLLQNNPALRAALLALIKTDAEFKQAIYDQVIHPGSWYLQQVAAGTIPLIWNAPAKLQIVAAPAFALEQGAADVSFSHTLGATIPVGGDFVLNVNSASADAYGLKVRVGVKELA